MSHPSPAYVTRLRNHIRSAEANADQSVIATLDTMRAVLHARQTEDAPAPHVGQQVVIRLARAMQAQIDASNDLFRAHAAMSKAHVDIFAVAPEDDTPPPEGLSEGLIAA